LLCFFCSLIYYLSSLWELYLDHVIPKGNKLLQTKIKIKKIEMGLVFSHVDTVYKSKKCFSPSLHNFSSA
jgi:hypothetical protein